MILACVIIKRMKIIIANWKSYISDYKEAKKLIDFYKSLSQNKKAVFIVAPPNIFLQSLRRSYKGKLLNFAAQSLGFSGACTGCISAKQLKNEKINFTIIGHSEQRARGLKDEDISKLVKEALDSELFPIIIVGEHKRDESAEYFKFVQKQIRSALKEYPKKGPLKFILAYEPVWAVGSKQAPKAHEIEMMMIYIRKTLSKLFGEKKAKTVPIIYGGSVNHLNIASILDLQSTDGVLLGRASVDQDELLQIMTKI